MLLAALTTYPWLAAFLNAMAHGCVMKSFGVPVCWATARCMLMVLPASVFVDRLRTDSRLWVLTLKRTGPFGEAPVLGKYAKPPRIATLLSWFGYAPVGKMKSVPGGMRARASPDALNPVSEMGLMSATAATVSVSVEMIVTLPAFASSAPSIFPGIGRARNCET